ncbi:MAG: patatin-like phospholipase family protein [Treponema sp.]|nr:patatin-like phospholipase family protein [Treponema sp.]
MKKLFGCLVLLITLTCAPAFSQEFGIVLAGGGGKGAYEVGVWKALNEYGIAQRTTTLSGTSVGGLNSALFVCVPPDQIAELWKNQVPSYLTEGDALISQPGLLKLINTIQISKLRNTYPRVTVTAVRNTYLPAKALLNSITSQPGSYASRFVLNDEPDLNEIKKKLLATAAFPVVCSPVKLKDGYEYYDGGFEQVGGDNIPLQPIVDNNKGPVHVNTIIIVYLEHNPKKMYREIDYDQFELIQIVPSIELGNLLDGTTNFTAARIEMLINKGYEDAVKVLKSKGYYPVSSYWFE